MEKNLPFSVAVGAKTTAKKSPDFFRASCTSRSNFISIHLHLDLPTSRSTYISILSTYLPTHPPTPLYIYVRLYLWPSISMSVYPYVRLSLCPSISITLNHRSCDKLHTEWGQLEFLGNWFDLNWNLNSNRSNDLCFWHFRLRSVPICISQLILVLKTWNFHQSQTRPKLDQSQKKIWFDLNLYRYFMVRLET